MSDDANPLNELIHELSVGLFKARLMLLEASPEEWRALSGRLTTLKDLVACFPTSPKPRKTVGFLGPVAKRKRSP